METEKQVFSNSQLSWLNSNLVRENKTIISKNAILQKSIEEIKILLVSYEEILLRYKELQENQTIKIEQLRLYFGIAAVALIILGVLK